ncbi:unnamed protein product [Brachionus calyciflorus]|uniref:Uncharacterized protein n=1 Tax=Brachionus calyciflorus TaxID=104777 RepID=A0A814IQ86_9BILA|nr:unnamed protein product [Brachionus calyciflorus]
MSKSVQVKRKPLVPIHQDYESESLSTIIRPTKSSRCDAFGLKSSDEEEDISFLVEFVDKANDYDIVLEKNVTLYPNDKSLGYVKHYSKRFEVKIIKRGSYDFVYRKAERYRYNLSIKTSDDNETERQQECIPFLEIFSLFFIFQFSFKLSKLMKILLKKTLQNP